MMPPSLFYPTKNTAHVWQLHWPSACGDVMEQALHWLTDDERNQAQRYKIADDKTRHCLGRAMLRCLSQRYTGQDGQSLVLFVTDQGKPYWRDFADTLHFNISHSGDWVMAAFAAQPVGVDVQATGGKHNISTIARHAFHPTEAAALASQPELFYPIWSCKEAIIKAVGTGLYGGTETFSVLPIPESSSIASLENNISFTTIKMDGGHVAALAVQGTRLVGVERFEFKW